MQMLRSMKQQKVFAGDRLYRLREQRDMTQTALAEALEISPSYPSQIESDQRPITRDLLVRLARLFGGPPSYFADENDLRLANELRETASDPLFGAGVSVAEASSAVRVAPAIAQRFLHLYRAFLALEEEHRSLQTRIMFDDASSPSRFPYDEVRDWVQSKRNYFDVLDRAAERLSKSRGFRSANQGDDIVRHLRDAHGIRVETEAGVVSNGMIWPLDRSAGTLFLSEDAPSSSRIFWIAHVIGLLEQGETIDRLVRQARLSNKEAAVPYRIMI